jgi:hypothetical protein
MNEIGFSVIYSSERDKQFYSTLLNDMLEAGCSAIELHTPHHDRLDDPDLLRLIAQFSYRAIHTSDLHGPLQDSEALAGYRSLAQRIGAAAITVHPHTMEHWGWLADHFGDSVSFENMDCFKPFGQTPEDMARVLREHPSARWTFDTNHVLTHDESLASVPHFYDQLGDPGHYHISGFRDASLPHTTLHTTRQDGVIDAIATDAPIIIESLGIADIDQFRPEYDYVVKRMSGI